MDKLICDFGSFDEAVIIKYLKQIMFGVGYLHEHRAIHRDIKGTHVFAHILYICIYVCMRTLYVSTYVCMYTHIVHMYTLIHESVYGRIYLLANMHSCTYNHEHSYICTFSILFYYGIFISTFSISPSYCIYSTYIHSSTDAKVI